MFLWVGVLEVTAGCAACSGAGEGRDGWSLMVQ